MMTGSLRIMEGLVRQTRLVGITSQDSWPMKDMADSQAYLEMQEYLDVQSFADYILAGTYIGLTDWPQNNCEYWCACDYPRCLWAESARLLTPFSVLKCTGYVFLRNDASPLGPTPAQFQAWDGEWSLDRRQGSGDGATFLSVFKDCSDTSTPIVKLWCSLRQSDEFTKLFTSRVALHTAPGGALSTEAALARWDSLTAFIESAIVAESARWGDSLETFGGQYAVTRTRNEDWQNEVDNLRNLLQGNTDQLIDELKNAGLYTDLPDPPVLSPNGGDVSVGSTFTISNPNGSGSIVYTTDGTDPTSSSSALNYNGPITVDASLLVQAAVSDGGLFSVVSAVAFKIPSFAVTEIHYHPADPSAQEVAEGFVDADEFEFIELRNVAQTNLDVADLTFSAGITISNLNSRIVSPGEEVVFVSNLAAFIYRYPGAQSQVVGVYEGALSNGGEQIEVQYPAGIIIASFEYDDVAPWPVEPDGSGPSLEVVDVTGDLNDPSNWRVSFQTGGSPGGVSQMIATSSPTESPSANPTTKSPSREPTKNPTLAPSRVAENTTLAPSRSAENTTLAPSGRAENPTVAPSKSIQNPTLAPSKSTQNPTLAPSKSTQNPTLAANFVEADKAEEEEVRSGEPSSSCIPMRWDSHIMLAVLFVTMMWL